MHNEISPHSAKFFKKWDELRAECEKLMREGVQCRPVLLLPREDQPHGVFCVCLSPVPFSFAVLVFGNTARNDEMVVTRAFLVPAPLRVVVLVLPFPLSFVVGARRSAIGFIHVAPAGNLHPPRFLQVSRAATCRSRATGSLSEGVKLQPTLGPRH